MILFICDNIGTFNILNQIFSNRSFASVWKNSNSDVDITAKNVDQGK